MADLTQKQSSILSVRLSVPAWTFRGDDAQAWSVLTKRVNDEIGREFGEAVAERYGETAAGLQALVEPLPPDAPGLEIQRMFVIMTVAEWATALEQATSSAYERGRYAGIMSGLQVAQSATGKAEGGNRGE